MLIHITGGDISQKELDAYIEHGRKAYPDKAISEIDIRIDGEFVDVDYHLGSVPFQRIRRITGYLVGGLGRWNDAKLHELADRGKHAKI